MKSPSTVEDDLNDWGPTPRRSLAQNYNTRRPTAPAGERRAVAAVQAIEPSLTSGRPTLLQLRLELELELTQPHMAQKPVLRGEVGCACVAREVSVEKM